MNTLEYLLGEAEKYGLPVPPGLKPPGTPMTAQYILNVRSGPGITYPIIDSLRTGQTVMVSEIVNGWAKIGDGRWCKEFYLA